MRGILSPLRKKCIQKILFCSDSLQLCMYKETYRLPYYQKEQEHREWGREMAQHVKYEYHSYIHH